MAKVMEQVEPLFPYVEFETVDTDTDPTLQLKHRAGLPSLLIYDQEGNFHTMLAGLQTAQAVTKAISNTP
jgi:thiol:disulfide interchange protein